MKIKKSKAAEPCSFCGEPSLVSHTLDDGIEISLCLSCDNSILAEYEEGISPTAEPDENEYCLKVVKLKYSEVENG
jgi:hypothetical protein